MVCYPLAGLRYLVRKRGSRLRLSWLTYNWRREPFRDKINGICSSANTHRKVVGLKGQRNISLSKGYSIYDT